MGEKSRRTWAIERSRVIFHGFRLGLISRWQLPCHYYIVSNNGVEHVGIQI